MGTPQPTKNPLLSPRIDKAVPVERIKAPTILARKKRDRRRELRDARRLENATAAITGFDRDTAIYGFTKGQFSLIQLVTAAIKITGPAELVVSTWTAANQDVGDVLEFCDAGLVTAARWLVDLTFSKRDPQLTARIRAKFGDDSIRVAKNHSKFVLLGNAKWRVVIQTSMNLNYNPRFENFEIAEDPQMYAFLETIVDEIWKRQARGIAGQSYSEMRRSFRDEL